MMTEKEQKVANAQHEQMSRLKNTLKSDITAARDAVNETFYPFRVLEVFGYVPLARLREDIVKKLDEVSLFIHNVQLEDYK